MERVDWFMHCHPGHGNTLVGVWPTPVGVYVRSWVDGTGAVSFYPMQPATRMVDDIIRFSRNVGEDQISSDVLADYHQRTKRAA